MSRCRATTKNGNLPAVEAVFFGSACIGHRMGSQGAAQASLHPCPAVANLSFFSRSTLTSSSGRSTLLFSRANLRLMPFLAVTVAPAGIVLSSTLLAIRDTGGVF